jgi:hypothetical protein
MPRLSPDRNAEIIDIGGLSKLSHGVICCLTMNIVFTRPRLSNEGGRDMRLYRMKNIEINAFETQTTRVLVANEYYTKNSNLQYRSVKGYLLFLNEEY